MNFKSFNTQPQVISEGTKLTPSVLDEKNSKTGEERIDILRDLVRGSKPLELAKGGTVVVVNIKDALEKIKLFKKNPLHFGRGGIPLETNGGTIYTNELKKSKVFGGETGGAGGGSLNTKIYESHNAVFLHAMLEHGHKQPLEFFTNDILKNAHKSAEVDATWPELENIPDEWMLSSYNISQELIKLGYVRKGHVVHRNSKIMNGIYQKKNEAFANMGLKKLKDDKWNPGDVWAVDKSFDINSLSTDTIDGLNADILENYLNRSCVGISLKGPMTKTVPIKEFNLDKSLLKTYKFKQFRLESKRGDYWSSKMGHIDYDGGELTIKDGKHFGSIKAEIKGKKARGGGLGWEVMSGYLERYGKKYALKPISKHAKKIAKAIERKQDEKSIKEYFKYYNYFYNNMSYKDFKAKVITMPGHWISAKFGITLLGYYINNIPRSKINELITNFVNYAGSSTAESSAYVKAGK